MDKAALQSELAELVADILDIDAEEVNAETSPDTTPEWDSLAHIKIVTAIEQKYGLSFEPEEQVEMLNFDLILDVVQEKIG